MKKTFSILFVALAVMLMPIVSQAQSVVAFGSPQQITGNATSPPVATIVSAWRVAPITLTLTNMSGGGAAVSNFVGNVYLSATSNSINGAALVGTVSLTNWTGVYSTNFAAYYTNQPMYIILQAQTGTNVVGVQEAYGP